MRAELMRACDTGEETHPSVQFCSQYGVNYISGWESAKPKRQQSCNQMFTVALSPWSCLTDSAWEYPHRCTCTCNTHAHVAQCTHETCTHSHMLAHAHICSIHSCTNAHTCSCAAKHAYTDATRAHTAFTCLGQFCVRAHT